MIDLPELGEGWHQSEILEGSFCKLKGMGPLMGKRVQDLSLLQCNYAFQTWCTAHMDELHERLPQIKA